MRYMGERGGNAALDIPKERMKKTMKRINVIVAIALAAAMCLTFAACTASPKSDNTVTPAPADGGNLKPDPVGNTETSAPITDKEKLTAISEFVRVGSDTQLGFEPLVITSAQQFADKVLPMLGTESRALVERKYNDEFFSKNHLIVFAMELSSGSMIPEVQDVTYKDGLVDVTVGGRMEGEIGTCDMAYYIGMLTLENSRYPSDAKVTVHGATVEDAAEHK